MKRVKFTKLVDERFGGTYSTSVGGFAIVATAGMETELPEPLFDRLMEDHPGLIEEVKSTKVKVPGAQDKMTRGGKAKSK